MLPPHQKDLRAGPHVWACLQQVVTQVGLPMWLLGTCHKKGYILVKHRASRKEDMANPEELIWETEYGPVLAVKVPHNVFNMAVKIEVHHLEDLVEKDGDATNTTYGFRNMGASPYLAEVFRKWIRRHRPELRRMRNTAVPLWQSAPKKWAPVRAKQQTTYSVVGGREAKKQKTTVMVQGPYRLELDQEYMENRPEPSPAYLPMCHNSRRGPYIDLRLYRAIVFLFQITSQCNAGPYAAVLSDLIDRSAEERYHDRAGHTIMWFAQPPTFQYWEHTAGLPETTVTITTGPGPGGRWVNIRKEAQSGDRHHTTTCKHYECPGPKGLTDTYIHVHGQAAVRPEVQDAMRVLLAELYASDAPNDPCPSAEDGAVRLYPMPVQEGARTYLEPKLEPGI